MRLDLSVLDHTLVAACEYVAGCVGGYMHHDAMAWVDVVDAAHELLPRHWKKWLGTGLVIAFLAFPNQARDATLWYAQERADQLRDRFLPVITRPLQPTTTPTK